MGPVGLDLNLSDRDVCGGGSDGNGGEDGRVGLGADSEADLDGEEGGIKETLSDGNSIDVNGWGDSGTHRFAAQEGPVPSEAATKRQKKSK